MTRSPIELSWTAKKKITSGTPQVPQFTMEYMTYHEPLRHDVGPAQVLLQSRGATLDRENLVHRSRLRFRVLALSSLLQPRQLLRLLQCH